jgi:polysaccharide pyruvyl transferase CsaB
MRIGIVGNYGHDNNGDEAILTGIIQQLVEYQGVRKEDIVVFSNSPEKTAQQYGVKAVYLLKKKGNFIRTVGSTLKQHIRVVQSLDVLIVGGGGLLMDMYKRDAPLYSSLVFIARLLRKKVMIYGVGAGPIQTALGKWLIRQMVQLSHAVFVRDEDSKQLLHRIGVRKEIRVIADPAFTLHNDVKKEERPAIRRIGVTAVPYFSHTYWPVANEEKYGQYVKNMAQNLDTLIEQLGAEIVLFSTKFPQDVQVTEHIYEQMAHQEAVTIKKDNLTPKRILKVCQDVDLVIGTRLHSLILAVAAETPIIGIGYHPKVKSFFETLNLSSMYVPIDGLKDPNTLWNVITNEYHNWNEKQQQFRTLSEQKRKEAVQGIRVIDQLGE